MVHHVPVSLFYNEHFHWHQNFKSSTYSLNRHSHRENVLALSNSLVCVLFTSQDNHQVMHMLTVLNQIVVKLSLLLWHPIWCDIFVWFLKIAVTAAEDVASFGIFNRKTVNNLVISHIFAHLNLLFIRLAVIWSVRNDCDYDVEDDNMADESADIQFNPAQCSPAQPSQLIRRFLALSLISKFCVLHVFSHEQRSAVFYHLSNAGCAQTQEKWWK